MVNQVWQAKWSFQLLVVRDASHLLLQKVHYHYFERERFSCFFCQRCIHTFNVPKVYSHSWMAKGFIPYDNAFIHVNICICKHIFIQVHAYRLVLSRSASLSQMNTCTFKCIYVLSLVHICKYYIWTYIWTYACAFLHVNIYTCQVHLYVCGCIYKKHTFIQVISKCICAFSVIHRYIYRYIDAFILVCIYRCIYSYMYKCIHASAFIHVHIFIIKYISQTTFMHLQVHMYARCICIYASNIQMYICTLLNVYMPIWMCICWFHVKPSLESERCFSTISRKMCT